MQRVNVRLSVEEELLYKQRTLEILLFIHLLAKEVVCIRTTELRTRKSTLKNMFESFVKWYILSCIPFVK